jgi:hypothetical protein
VVNKDNRVNIPDFAIPEYGLIIEHAGLEEREYKFGLYMKMCAFRKLGVPFIVIRPEDFPAKRLSVPEWPLTDIIFEWRRLVSKHPQSRAALYSLAAE